MNNDPTAPLRERTPEQIDAYIDDHIIMALQAADMRLADRQSAEDYLRNRLVAISDSWPDAGELAGEQSRRTQDRLKRLIFPEED